MGIPVVHMAVDRDDCGEHDRSVFRDGVYDAATRAEVART